MRVVLLGSGGAIPAAALAALGARAGLDIVAVVRPEHPGRGPLRAVARRFRELLRHARGGAEADPLASAVRAAGLPEWRVARDALPALDDRLRRERVDLVIVATFPWLLPPPVLDAPAIGAFNLHPSLLPRHRGPNPWFWTYHADDREVGVTLHRCDPRADAGAIVAQRRWALPRGHPVEQLHHEAAEAGADLLGEVLARGLDGFATALPQDESAATRAPAVVPGRAMLDPNWGSERTWHFLAGLAGRYREPLLCEGRAVPYRSVPGFDLDHRGGHDAAGAPHAPAHVASTPGTVRAEAGGWRLTCADGSVRLAP